MWGRVKGNFVAPSRAMSLKWNKKHVDFIFSPPSCLCTHNCKWCWIRIDQNVVDFSWRVTVLSLFHAFRIEAYQLGHGPLRKGTKKISLLSMGPLAFIVVWWVPTFFHLSKSASKLTMIWCIEKKERFLWRILHRNFCLYTNHHLDSNGGGIC